MKAKEKNNVISKKTENKHKKTDSIAKRDIKNISENNVSVFTKSINPRVIIKSEDMDQKPNLLIQNMDKHQILKVCCLIIMCIILLMTFFLSLKTYNTVQELSDYIFL